MQPAGFKTTFAQPVTLLVLLFCTPAVAASREKTGDGETGSAVTASSDTYMATTTGPASPWPMFRRDHQHTGYTPYTGPPAPTVAWTYQATDGIASSPTIGTDGTIYVGAGWNFAGANDHHLYALHPDGNLKWSFEAEDGFFSSPALGANNTIYITSLDGHLYAIEDVGTHGQQKWRTYLDFFFNLSSPAVGADGTVYVGSPSFDFYAISPDDGSVNWSWPTDWCIISSPAIAGNGTIYIGSKDHHLYAFHDAIEGPIWQFPTGTFYDGHLVDSSPAIGADGTVYFGTDPYGAAGQTPVEVDTSFWAVNPDGTLKWSFDTEDGVESSPAIGPDGTLYFGSYDGYLYAVTDNGSEGVLEWKFPTGGAIDGSPTVDGDGVIYFGSRDALLYALYPDGTVKWTFPATHGFESSPTIDDNGYLYIGNLNGNLYALGTGGPDVGVASVDIPSEVVINATYLPRATIRNYRGAERQVNVACIMEAGDTIVYSDTGVVTVSGGGSKQHGFGPWQVGPGIAVDYTVTVTAELAGDENPDNDEHTIVVTSVEHGIVPAVPTVSEWGLAVMAGLISVAGAGILIERRGSRVRG